MNMKTHTQEPQQKDKPPTSGQEVAERTTGTELAVVDFGDDAGKGMENISPDERKIPFIRILQSNSPECEEGNAKFMPNAKAGLFINTSTKALYSKLIMIPAARDHKFIEYTPRAIGGGFVAVHKPDDQLILMLRAKHGKFGKLPHNITKRDQTGQALDGTEIVESFELYSIFIDPETNQKFRAIASFQSTQIKAYTTFIDRYDSIQYGDGQGGIVKPPLWAHKWLISTGNERNKKGAFKGYVVGLLEKKPDGSDDLPIKSLIKRSEPLYAEGKEFNAFVEAGRAEVDYSAGVVDEAAKPEDEVEM